MAAPIQIPQPEQRIDVNNTLEKSVPRNGAVRRHANRTNLPVYCQAGLQTAAMSELSSQLLQQMACGQHIY